MPKEALPSGHLHLAFTTRPPPHSHVPLALLRPSHFPLAVIGIGSCSRTDSLSATLSQFNHTLLDLFPADGIYPLARNCFVFEEGDGKGNVNLGEVPSGLVVIPEIMGNKKIYLGTLLADICSNILGEFATLVRSYF
jgi:trafficking protein particle complex subunit 9